uniref:RNA-directed DNA polymerase, eukaryota n=1 Tax=Tanacetum cinerariifolium TaxID=118510 RepID=A0A6L2L842_TANCI|nr:RNA-directed DNA polymerase, eukaryota [Tanacetum cinerariifolium]
MTVIYLSLFLCNHRPILLNEIHTDYGPTPFRVYHSWFKRDGFDALVENAWNSFTHNDSNWMIRFKKKLQDLKKIIRVWIRESNASQVGAKKVILDDLVIIDKKLDKGMVSDELLAKRIDLSHKLHDLKQMELKDVAQKAKVNWAIEGDENSKFFHGVISKRRSQLAIRGVFVNGDWYTDPSMVKEAFMDHFTARFKQPSCGRLKLNMSFPNRLSSDQVGDLDKKDISINEIRKAVLDCGESKSPGLDGFTFEFFRRYWHFIGPDFCAAVNCFFDKGRFPRGSNSSFIALILKVLAWCKRRRKQALVFKVDFAKACDSVRWDFLLDVLLAFGFGPKWCQWIRGIFSSNMSSILINGSPSSEFLIFSGLKQGDHLAPFLFILVMESLHLSVTRAVNDDDAIFIGEWSIGNLDNLLKILKCFHLASGLCINVNKSHVLGVGVPLYIVRQGALCIGCEVMQTPFKYLGVMVGDHMSRYSAWSNTIQKVRGRLTRWKVKTLSIGGRLTLLKSVLSAVLIYNMSLYKAPKCVLHELERLHNNFFKGGDSQDSKITWVAWAKVLSSKKNGGLGLSSFFALNRALLLKWVWRYLVQDGSLWYHIISDIYGSRIECHYRNTLSPWGVILREVHQLASKAFRVIGPFAIITLKYRNDNGYQHRIHFRQPKATPANRLAAKHGSTSSLSINKQNYSRVVAER